MLVIMMRHTSHSVADQVIPQSDIGRLTNLLSDAATKSFDLGIQLGIRDGQLKKIEEDYGNSVGRRMTEVLIAWVKGTEHPTVGKLVGALRSQAINELQLAREVSEMYPVHPGKRDTIPRPNLTLTAVGWD